MYVCVCVLPPRSHVCVGAVFAKNNLAKLLAGTSCITPISGSAKISLLDKNIVQIKKQKDGSVTKLPVNSDVDSIQLAAQLGAFSLDCYGVSKGLSETMDVASQVAVAAGMEALKSAGLVRGGGTDAKVSPRHTAPSPLFTHVCGHS